MRFRVAELQFWHVNFIFVISAESLWQDGTWDETWDNWWHYKEGAIGGPSHWGQTTFMMYAEDIWPACFRGKQQSPISIKVKDLIYDHTLKTLDIEGISSELTFNVTNAGQNVNILLDPASMPVYFKGGPLSYQYRVHGALIKFGSSSQLGSEHQIDDHAFPGEIQLYAFNADLYSNFSVAVSRPNGVAAVSFFLKIGTESSPDLSALISTISEVKLKGESRRLFGLILKTLLPDTQEFMTYQGSLTFPACHESVTWILLNHAATVTEEQMKELRTLRMSEFEHSGPIADNFRPIQSTNNRFIRTNIHSMKDDHCDLRSSMIYTGTYGIEAANL